MLFSIFMNVTTPTGTSGGEQLKQQSIYVLGLSAFRFEIYVKYMKVIINWVLITSLCPRVNLNIIVCCKLVAKKNLFKALI